MREGGGSRSSPASVLAVAAEELGGLEFTGASHSSARGGPVACGLASKRKLTASLHCHDPALRCTENQGPGAAPREEKDPPPIGEDSPQLAGEQPARAGQCPNRRFGRVPQRARQAAQTAETPPDNPREKAPRGRRHGRATLAPELSHPNPASRVQCKILSAREVRAGGTGFRRNWGWCQQKQSAQRQRAMSQRRLGRRRKLPLISGRLVEGTGSTRFRRNRG